MDKKITFVMLFLFLGKPVFSQIYISTATPPRLSTTSVDAAATFDSATGIFHYSYTIGNSRESTGGIISFDLDLSTTPGSLPSSAGLENSPNHTQKGITSFNSANLAEGIVPIGIENSPPSWVGAISAQRTISWFEDTLENTNILPGAKRGSFALSSHGPPGVRQFWTAAYVDLSLYFQGIDNLPENLVEQSMAAQRAATAGAMWTGYTIGPGSLPSGDPSGLVTALAATKHQLVSIGWLKGDGFVEKLDEILDRVEKKLSDSKVREARGELKLFVALLEEQQGRQRGKPEGWRGYPDKFDSTLINENAFTVLKLNAEYILSLLPEKEGEGRQEFQDRVEKHDAR